MTRVTARLEASADPNSLLPLQYQHYLSIASPGKQSVSACAPQSEFLVYTTDVGEASFHVEKEFDIRSVVANRATYVNNSAQGWTATLYVQGKQVGSKSGVVICFPMVSRFRVGPLAKVVLPGRQFP